VRWVLVLVAIFLSWWIWANGLAPQVVKDTGTTVRKGVEAAKEVIQQVNEATKGPTQQTNPVKPQINVEITPIQVTTPTRQEIQSVMARTVE